MEKAISVGDLRRNPTQMLRAVRGGQTYTITDHGEPIANVTPRRETQWVQGAQLSKLLGELDADAAWAREIEETRAAEDPRDPWGSTA